ncbi:helix-turn-helix domain-containing protein [Jannaschia sp. CCS1]|uniref:helix-turn-helix domain-containing protein n=1 Tax=Jannaschia sp. (strain CCS1) TaxID=290400 RepID=UPI000053D088|nr:helix-turn-helix transcriptional regulator [Jannaschia sp. CCS1]ABD56453.1 transcriptional regulator, XRE family [Jannaschia sp. CCS1]
MDPDAARDDCEEFGRLVRKRRLDLGLSQEALAEAALGNPDRKSFISAIENNRLTKITPNTARKLSGPLGLNRGDIPTSLRWPSANGPLPTEERLRALEAKHAPDQFAIEDRAIARFLNRHMATMLQRSMFEIYRERLIGGLEFLAIWTGRPFSLQSLLTCYALGLLYVVLAGLVSFFHGDIFLGSVNPFRVRNWAGAGFGIVLQCIGFVVLGLAFAWCWRLVREFGLNSLTERQIAIRLGCLALIAGVACGVVDYFGTASLTAAVLFTVPSCAAISTLPPKRAAFYGATGGIIFGLMAAISSGLTDDTLLALVTSLSEGFIIGGIVGTCAGLVSSLIAARMSRLRPGQLAAAGGGVASGGLVSFAGLVLANDSVAISDGTLGLFSVTWLALPLANAALDFISLGISHAIGRYIVFSGARSGTIAVYIAVDMALAVIFMVLTVVVIGLALNGVTWSVGVETMSGEFLERSAADPWGEGLWLTTMALTTIVWTWLHYAFVVAPLASGALTQRLIERIAARRLIQARRVGDFDVSVGVLVSMRGVLFYGCWAALAVLPVVVLVAFPGSLKILLTMGWRVADVFI